jgi:cell division protein FtsI/penicillin-binding protein 2
MTAAVANGGTLVTPHVASAVVDGNGNVVRAIQPAGKQIPIDPEYLADIRAGMAASVDHGAGIAGQVPGLQVFGKTGTSQYYEYSEGGKTYQHAWFTGFATIKGQPVVVTVYYDRGVGGAKAAPTAANILKYFSDNVTP